MKAIKKLFLDAYMQIGVNVIGLPEFLKLYAYRNVGFERSTFHK